LSPIDLATLDQFDPATVPTCSKLMGEGMTWLHAQRSAAASSAAAAAAADEEDGAGVGAGAGAGAGAASGAAKRGAVDLNSRLFEHTSMKPYIDYFEAWLRELGATAARARREAAERAGAASGEASAW
jgi:hypothetical protein